mgnify:CR=1 FL=1
MTLLVEAQHLCVQYNDHTAVNNVTLSINKGEIVTLIGPNGAGKTTLVRAILGLTPVSSGLLTKKPALSIGYMPQKVQLIRSTLRHNLDLKGQHTDAELHQALTIAQLDEWLTTLPNGLDTWIGKGEWEPSGGETKRLGLARLLLQQPEIILLDEPFAGMDLELQRGLLNELRQQWSDRLTLIVSHDLELKAPEEPIIEL